jgi:hypothetical protein
VLHVSALSKGHHQATSTTYKTTNMYASISTPAEFKIKYNGKICRSIFLAFGSSPGVEMWLAEHDISELPVSSVFRWNRTGVPKRRREPSTSIHWVKTKKTKEWISDRGKSFNTSAQLFVYHSISLFFDSAVVFIRHIHNSSTQSYPGNIPTSDHLRTTHKAINCTLHIRSPYRILRCRYQLSSRGQC